MTTWEVLREIVVMTRLTGDEKTVAFRRILVDGDDDEIVLIEAGNLSQAVDYGEILAMGDTGPTHATAVQKAIADVEKARKELLTPSKKTKLATPMTKAETEASMTQEEMIEEGLRRR